MALDADTYAVASALTTALEQWSAVRSRAPGRAAVPLPTTWQERPGGPGLQSHASGYSLYQRPGSSDRGHWDCWGKVSQGT